MSDAVKIALMTSLANGLVTWGVVSTKLEWLRIDQNKLEIRIERIENRMGKP